ncbi:leukocyte receptor cluster member 1 [Drosophila innubila]|uniref:leukocyte receptor cluster member 1 n=1 Tax=Drosophila innubila TaxID=198719 RepID=UPI00148C98BA|nr:leukocyte receptor cluster member 1 [Drosophila innubila]
MNILPKKRWHVRTKDNIARVRRDEAAAQDEERKRLDKLELAESEARINFLRRQSGLPEKLSTDTAAPGTSETSTEEDAQNSAVRSVDLFADYKSHVKKTNKDLEKEKKDEQEKYEKQIGYLTYLGQDTNEALKVRSWYEVAPKRAKIDDRDATETHLKQKLSEDPLTLVNALISGDKKSVQAPVKRREPPPEPSAEPESIQSESSRSKKHKKEKKHHKKHKKHKHKNHKVEKLTKEMAANAKRDKLNMLRKERLLREAAEQRRQEQLFAPKESELPVEATKTPAPTPRIVQKYNSQFNPELAKQNMI